MLFDCLLFEVSNEKLWDYVYFLRREVNYNVEVVLLSFKEFFDFCWVMDFVFYEDEIIVLVFEFFRDNYWD